jgi:hypothetical protein
MNIRHESILTDEIDTFATNFEMVTATNLLRPGQFDDELCFVDDTSLIGNLDTNFRL